MTSREITFSLKTEVVKDQLAAYLNAIGVTKDAENVEIIFNGKITDEEFPLKLKIYKESEVKFINLNG